METALWTALAVMLGVGAKGAAAGETPMPADEQIELLKKARAELEKKVRDLQLRDKENTIEAKRSVLYEEKQAADKSKREITEAEAIWSRATPEVLERFARQRMKKEAGVPAQLLLWPSVDRLNPYSPERVRRVNNSIPSSPSLLLWLGLHLSRQMYSLLRSRQTPSPNLQRFGATGYRMNFGL